MPNYGLPCDESCRLDAGRASECARNEDAIGTRVAAGRGNEGEMDAVVKRTLEKEGLIIRPVRVPDVPQVIAIDARITGLAKSDYWQEAFQRYGRRRQKERFFLVAEADERKGERRILGFIIGEIRAWEFGDAPCGWVFALSVDPDTRLYGIGHELFVAISEEFRKAGMTKMRTMVARDNRLHSLFFRGEGMMAGPYIQLEKELG
jgi:ribosomal protein S18 acetylase RimI-like enzyme